MNPFEMVAIIVVAVMIASVLRAKYTRRGRCGDDAPEIQSENLRLHDEVKELKERIKVLERITVEKENSLARQIEELRDR
jgi:cell division protein FtsL